VKLAAPATQVTYAELRWMCACLALALAAQAASLPLWLLAVIGAAAGIRLWLAARGYAAPSRTIRSVIAVVSIGLLFLQLRTFNGLAAGSALLSLVAGLKILETQSRRDLYVVALIIYFLCLAQLLRSESFWLLAYLTGTAWCTSATLLRLTHASPPVGWRRSARYAGRISAQALPIALILWLLFPRFDSPLWRTPADGHGAESGLSDTMTPGDITDLALSDDVAFRVHFSGPAPPPAERYWRGPVLHDFDGNTWRRLPAARVRDSGLAALGPAYRYVISLEPHQHNWLFALDWPDGWSAPEAYLTSDYMLVRPALVSRALDVTITSHTAVRAEEPLGEAMRRRDTRLPAQRNPKTLQLASELRAAHPGDAEYVEAVLEMFRRQQFFYTLEPPPLGANSVDEFLFDTKQGFCGHYASAFAALTRAAGIPTRVVTGYYGGTYNRFADYWIVRQSDAHAWDEVWIEGRGWWRVDPTSAVPPGRVQAGLERSLTAGARLGGAWRGPLSWVSDARLELDALRQLWRQRILNFNQQSQYRLLTGLGIPEPDGQKIAMVMGGALALAFGWLTWQIRREQRPRPKDPVVRAYDRLCRKLAAAGLARRPHEGAEMFGERVALERPDLGPRVIELCRRYSRLRYGAHRRVAVERWFVARVRAFNPRGILPRNGR
jgi:transglutaminase-like putative cysteine protease